MNSYEQELKNHERLTELDAEKISVLKTRIDLINKEAQIKKKLGFQKTQPDYYFETEKEYLELQSLHFDNHVDEQINAINETIFKIELQAQQREMTLKLKKETEDLKKNAGN